MKTLKTTNRRKFLLAAGLGSAGAVAAVVAKSPAVPKQASSVPGAAQPDGYHATEHIQKYYKTTEV